MPSAHPNLYRRVTASVPLLVTVLVHIVLIAITGYFVVSEQMIGRKKTFEAVAATESVAQKQVEHRLQVARKGGGSASSSPVSASRIFSTAENALQMPALPDLPSVGASSLSGMGFGAGMGGVGAGTGYNTGIGNSGSPGRGFMSMSFLGITNQGAKKVVFVVDIGAGVMDIRKGGFRAFEIMRTEITRLVGRLPPTAEFNIVFFDDDNVRLFATSLRPATVANKTVFFDWIKPVNASLQALGTRSIPAASPRWTFERAEKLKLDLEFYPSRWLQGLHAALEQQPDTVFLITGSSAPGKKKAVISAAEMTRRKQEYDRYIDGLKRQGLAPDAVNAARGKALAKLRADFNAVNRRLVELKKPPFVIKDIRRVLDPDFQAAVKKAGFTLKLDRTGWTDKNGQLIWEHLRDNEPEEGAPADTTPAAARVVYANAAMTDAVSHVSLLQYGLLSERASLNVFLFVGSGEKTEGAEKNLGSLASRNGGRFALITTKSLEELAKNETP